MKKESVDNLVKKGWSREELNRVENIISNIGDKSRSLVQTRRILFWTIIAIMVIGNALVAFILIPFLLMMTSFGANLFVGIIGFVVGVLFNFLVWDIGESLDNKHFWIAGILIPVLAVVDLFAMVKVTNAINNLFQISSSVGNPITISGIYVVAFLIPYLFTLFYKNKIKRYEY